MAEVAEFPAQQVIEASTARDAAEQFACGPVIFYSRSADGREVVFEEVDGTESSSLLRVQLAEGGEDGAP